MRLNERLANEIKPGATTRSSTPSKRTARTPSAGTAALSVVSLVMRLTAFCQFDESTMLMVLLSTASLSKVNCNSGASPAINARTWAGVMARLNTRTSSNAPT